MKTIFWNVDTQEDFMYKSGKLYVPGAETIIPALERTTEFAREAAARRPDVYLVSTADEHDENSKEISATPDYRTTWPPHCMEGTPGQRFIPETAPANAYTIRWKDASFDPTRALESRNIILTKDSPDIYAAPHTDAVLDAIDPEGDAHYIAYGVVTNICVGAKVEGRIRRGGTLTVITDAVKEIDCDVQALYDDWARRSDGKVRFATTADLERLLR